MYQNCNCRTNPNSHPQFFIRRSDIAFDPRVAYVESVCASLAESRFGPGRVLPVTVNWSDRLENEPAVFFDLLDDGATVSYWDAQLCGRCASPHVSKGETHNVGRYALAHARAGAKFSGTQNTAGGNGSVNERAVLRPPLTPNQGRGSP